MDELQVILNQLENLTQDDLAKVQKFLNDQARIRRIQREKTLWGNITAAIHKYQSEIGTINITLPDDDSDASICDLSSPGNIVVQYD